MPGKKLYNRSESIYEKRTLIFRCGKSASVFKALFVRTNPACQFVAGNIVHYPLAHLQLVHDNAALFEIQSSSKPLCPVMPALE
jgi:hypothetical protein